MQDLARSTAEILHGFGAAPARRLLLLAIALIAVFTVTPAPISASGDHEPPVARRMERPRFVFDAGTVWRNGEPWVEIDVAVPYAELMFHPEEGRYRATFDLIAVLTSGGRQLTGDLWHETVESRTLAEARSSMSLFRRFVTLRGKPGKLRVEVTVSEQSSGNEGRLTQDLEIRDPMSQPIQIGKIWFVRCGSDTSSSPRSGIRDRIAGRRFGATAGPVCASTQIFMHEPGDTTGVDLHWKILGERRETIAERRLRLPASADTIPASFRLPVETLWLGGYELWVEASAGGRTTTRVADFDMDETTVSLNHNPAESIALVRYIAAADELVKLEEAPPEERERAWTDFWKKCDPTPDTDQNEFKEEFFRRVRFANENFSSLGPGWRTDRGMIYIQYGPPDQIESYPHNVDGPPYEVWFYYDQRRRFVFVDYDGFGRYELATPGRLH